MCNYYFGFSSLISVEEFAGLDRNTVWTDFIFWRFFLGPVKTRYSLVFYLPIFYTNGVWAFIIITCLKLTWLRCLIEMNTNFSHLVESICPSLNEIYTFGLDYTKRQLQMNKILFGIMSKVLFMSLTIEYKLQMEKNYIL